MNFYDLAESVAMNNGRYKCSRLDERINDSLTARVTYDNNKTVIIKLWTKPGVRGKIRQLTHTGNLDRECKTLNLLYNNGIKVPKTLAGFRFKNSKNGYTDALVIQDLGPCTRAVDVISDLIKNSQSTSSERIKIEDKIISLTQSIVELGIIDRDHNLINIVILPSGDVVRIDFELASIVYKPKWHRQKLTVMIGSLLSTYIVAVQSDLELIDAFSIRLFKQLRLSPKALQLVNVIVNRHLEKQKEMRS